MLKMLVRYKAWANDLTFSSLEKLPAGEALLPRKTRFGNMVRTLTHVYVVDDIFKHHLEGRTHGYTSRVTDHTPSLEELRQSVRKMDQWYIDQVDGWSEEELRQVIRFEFVGGGAGAMTREDIILHLVNHGTYHRGFVGDMMYQVPFVPPANDLTVFLRDHYTAPAPSSA